jgi:8-oxo-dGTP pyrophosphatase MutT (NUDIX family)
MNVFAGAHVFPGGRVDDVDRADEAHARHSLAACRELEEETQIRIEPEALVAFARWITPEREARRFDAMFFLAVLPAGAVACANSTEVTEVLWTTPAAALAMATRDEIRLAPPTWVTLDRLSEFSTIDDALSGLSREPLTPITPRIVNEGGVRRLEIAEPVRWFELRGGRWVPVNRR